MFSRRVRGNGRRGTISVSQVMRTILPFYGALTATMLLITYVPALSLWLPHLVGHKPL